MNVIFLNIDRKKSMRKLLIVESPAKAKTINKYLGNDWVVLASFGHVRDLPRKSGSIDVDNNFQPTYQIIAKNKKHVDAIIAQAKQCEEIYLATDQDREGESISWHIKEILIAKKLVAKKVLKRVTFNEITKNAILNAINNSRELDLNLVEAQVARLTLDYLIGFNISPLLWRKIKPKLSAGRVQSPALRLICEREQEIKAFIPEDYFNINARLDKDKMKLIAKIIAFDGKKIEQKSIKNKQEVESICNILSQEEFAKVTNIIKKQKKKNPSPPFITSSLQIDASRKLGFYTDKTMKVAQNLYEGIDVGNEVVGLITYMRTDSVNLSQDAITEIRHYIQNKYDKKYLPSNPIIYKSKVKNAQEAHEAIRPTSIYRTPESLRQHLTSEQFKLYELIWLRTLASQLSPAILDTTSVDLELGKGLFRINGVSVNFDGFMCLYNEEKAEEDDDNEDNQKLPYMSINDKLLVEEVFFTQHQTQPKPRYTEALLVKSLEELGIGRPSTYASIISTLKKREYVMMDKKKFIPTDIGMIVSQFLTTHLPKYVDLQFTANLEDTLDEISNGKLDKLPIIKSFWIDLKTTIDEKQNISRTDLIAEKLDESCPQCGNGLIIRLGKYGRFIGCSGYPECKYMRKVESEANEGNNQPEAIEDRVCPKDEGELLIRNGKYGKFIACKNYPKCKYIENINDKTNSDYESVKCPNCSNGNIVARKNRYGNWFYACDSYPTCKTIYNHKPINKVCPKCQFGFLIHKITKRYGIQNICPSCDFSENLQLSE
jgi:DNA topoisomerase-1